MLPKIKSALSALNKDFDIKLLETFSQIGSGALPLENIPSVAICISPVNQIDDEIRKLAHALRQLPKPVIGRTQNGKILLDLRCLDTDPAVEEKFIEQLSLLQESA